MKRIRFYKAHFGVTDVPVVELEIPDDETVIGTHWTTGPANHHVLVVTESEAVDPPPQTATSWRPDDT